MTAGDGSLRDSWEALRRIEDACPWPGLRPIVDGARAGQLKGRDTDAIDIMYEIRDHRLTVLFGDSGVGKTSLLAVKVIPKLADEGFRVAWFREWREVSGDVEPYLDAQVAAQLSEGGFEELDDRYGRRFVLILDQFEEAIRHQPELSERVQAWVVEATERYDFRIVIALRSEYEHRLRNLKIAPYQRIDLYLGPIQQEHIGEIVDAGPAAISKDAVARVLELWTAAKGNEGWARVGLPHLQALLYALWGGVAEDGRTVIEAGDVVRFATGAESGGNPSFALSEEIAEHAFESSIRRAVALGLQHAKTSFDAIGDPYLIAGARSHVVRMARMLSSGGFKVDQDRWHLARQVLADEIRILEIDPDDAGRVFHQVAWSVDAEHQARHGHEPGADWLTMHRRDLVDAPRAARAPSYSGDDATYLLRSIPSGRDSNESTSGPVMDLPPAHALVEEFRRFFLALEWLDEAAIVRQSTVNPFRTIVFLTHDAIGRGLDEWAARNEADPERDLRVLTALLGRRIDWSVSVEGADPETPRLVANLRWRACHVKVEFRNVVFLNCDFRESVFQGCAFEGVQFVNCLLDGVTFRGCAIVGDVGDLTVGEEEAPSTGHPTFHTPAEPEARIISRYRESDMEPSGLRSELGPASPGAPADSDREISRRTGGLFLLGSRLSSLMFAGCQFGHGSAVGLLYSSGTSLEFAEQGAGSLYLRDVVLRGFSISPAYATAPAPDARLAVRIAKCLAGNIWVSEGVRGHLTIVDSVVWQVLHAGTSDDFTFSFDDELATGAAVNVRASKGFGLVNIGIEPPPGSGDQPDAWNLGGEGDRLRFLSRTTDYRGDADTIDEAVGLSGE
ncbi:pentapeptide repeat-containing protein [Pseudolysinimonas yzui]|uniref:Novel STAND NTPase 1 domain-containing protein n=1 Tax=Pseudolysinimonas yzui TaxID=2708254 RepID=A0A8J3GQF4_9MICO|nr:pentapeptide repeat-containing protein [Pseudolysinimonas yzui]GHF14727.1 hypothetical protein GCM10011600_14590 [Pseudolysinimonas yzui]